MLADRKINEGAMWSAAAGGANGYGQWPWPWGAVTVSTAEGVDWIGRSSEWSQKGCCLRELRSAIAGGCRGWWWWWELATESDSSTSCYLSDTDRSWRVAWSMETSTGEFLQVSKTVSTLTVLKAE